MAKLHLHVKQLSSKYGYRHLPINLQLPDGEVESQRGSLWIAALQMLNATSKILCHTFSNGLDCFVAFGITLMPQVFSKLFEVSTISVMT